MGSHSPYDDSPEVAPDTLPQVYHAPPPPPQPQQQTSWQQQPKPETSLYDSNTSSPTSPPKKGRGLVCGCSLLVLVLSVVIAILAMAVIGLAAGTGVASSKYNDAITQLNALSSSYSALQGSATVPATTTGKGTATSSGAKPTATSKSDITNGCSNDNENVSGTIYQSNFFNNASYTMYCNRNAPKDPLFSLFTADFSGCIEACTAWNNYNSTKKGCTAVSFIPPWTSIASALSVNAPGDCYLKPGPQTKTGLEVASVKDGAHAAILNA
ncbi:hypothetical protein QQS21_003671 [Conoideocrella luteorostrata]|uniref:Uncharacterized protein n=1 Tax=Conoideocrella luteorostrata TaxID=1105319 RepID=A0AAJ0G0D9_9HYPO|nr:hypothetical protein QQS21_003671 [Conoideocrella luteorostrata]